MSFPGVPRGRLATISLVVASGLLGGCGYRWVASADGLGPVESVRILTLRNDSFEPGVELVVTDALLREFMRRRDVRIVTDPGAADLVLSGAVLPVETRGRSLSSVVFALEYEVVLRLELEAKRPDGTQVPLDASVLTDAELYLASADVEASRKNREEAIRRLAGAIAGRVHDALAEELAR